MRFKGIISKLATVAIAVASLVAMPVAPASAAPANICPSGYTASAGYCTTTFSTVGSDTWTTPANVFAFDALIVGGGGGGTRGICQYSYGQGGGGGGVLELTNITTTPGTAVTVAVGAGGAATGQCTNVSLASYKAGDGGASSISKTGYTATANGGIGPTVVNGNSNGAASGSTNNNGTVVAGKAGGAVTWDSSTNCTSYGCNAGAGGGAGAAASGINAGTGTLSAITGARYGGGGSGYKEPGGFGTADSNAGHGSPCDGAANSGGGGSDCTGFSRPGAGGSGIVVIRYKANQTITKSYAGSTWSLLAAYHGIAGETAAQTSVGVQSLFTKNQNATLATTTDVLALAGSGNEYSNQALWNQVNNGYLLEAYNASNVEVNIKGVLNTANHTWDQLGNATVSGNFVKPYAVNSAQLYNSSGTVTTTYGYLGTSSGAANAGWADDNGDYIMLGVTNQSSQGTGDSFDTTFNAGTQTIGLGVSDGSGTGSDLKSFTPRGNAAVMTMNAGSGASSHSGNTAAGWVFVWVRGAGPAASPAPTATSATQYKVGATLTGTDGTWTGSGTVTITNRIWQSSTDGSNWTDIAGATASTYTLTANEANKYVRYAVTATDTNGSTTAGTATVLITTTPTFTASTPTTSVLKGSVYTTYTFAASGSRITYSVGSGALPTGLSLNASTGALSGTPTVSGAFTYAISATNDSGTTTTANISLAVNDAPLWTSNTPTTAMLTGANYSYTFVATGYPAPTYTVTSGTLPAGMTLDSNTGVFSGTPTTVGSNTVTFQASNGIGTAVTVSKTFTVTAGTQATLYLIADSTSLTYDPSNTVTTTVTTSGGSGTGAISYSIQAGSTGVCSVSGSGTTATVTAITAGSCTVIATKASDASYASANTSVTITINKASQNTLSVSAETTSFNFQASPALTTTVSATGGSGTGATTYAIQAGSASVCSISGTTVTILSAGNCVVVATKAADGNFLVTTGSVTITIAKGNQAAFSANAASTSLTYRASPALTTTVSTTGGSGTGSVTYAIASHAASVCSISGTTVTVLGAGTCEVIATKAADSNFVETTASVNITIAKANQSALNVSAATSSFTYRSSPDLTTTVSTTGGSGTGSVTFEVSAASASVCSISGNAVTVLTAGSCVIIATKAADDNYSSTTGSVTITINKGSQGGFAISAADTSLTYSPSPALTTTVSTTGGSGTGAITYAVAAQSASVCSVSADGTVTVLTAGSCVISATKEADTNYLVATDTVTIAISKANQSDLGASADPSELTLSAQTPATANLATTGGSGTGSVSWSVDSGSSSICSVSGSVVTALLSGTCHLTATKAGDTNYLAVSASLSIVIVKAAQDALTVTAGSTSLTFKASPKATTTLSASGGSSTGGISYAVDADSSSICSISGSVVTALAAGTCHITATKAGDNTFLDITGSITLTINKGSQAALNTSATPTELTLNAQTPATSTLSASGGSGSGSVSWSVDANSSSICSVSGNLVTALLAGTCYLTATKAGDSNYLATSASLNIVIAKGYQSALTATANPSTITFRASPKSTTTLSATGGSTTGAITYAVDADYVGVCSVSGNVVTALAAGTCLVIATRAGDDNFLEVSDELAITINKGSQLTLVLQANNQSLTFNPIDTASTTLSASGGSGNGEVSWEVIDGDCTIDGGLLYAYSAGTCDIRGTKAGDDNYTATSATITITIAKGAQVALDLSADTTELTYNPVTRETTRIYVGGGSSLGAVTLAIAPASNGFCSLDGTLLKAVKAGTCVVNVTKAGDSNYTAISDSITFTIAKADQDELSAPKDIDLTVTWNGKKAISFGMLGGSGTGAVTAVVTANSIGICTVTSSLGRLYVTGLAKGVCSVNVTKAADNNFTVAVSSFEVMVLDLPKAPTGVIVSRTGNSTDEGIGIRAEWTPVTADSLDAVTTGYEVQFKTGANWVTVDGCIVDAQTFSCDFAVTPWTSMYLRVAATSDYDPTDATKRNWGYFKINNSPTASAFNVPGEVTALSVTSVAAVSLRTVTISGRGFDPLNNYSVSVSAQLAVLNAGPATLAKTVTLPARVIDAESLQVSLPGATLPNGVNSQMVEVRVIGLNGLSSDPLDLELTKSQDTGDGVIEAAATDTNKADPDTEPAVAVEMADEIDAGGGALLGVDPETGALKFKFQSQFVGTVTYTVSTMNRAFLFKGTACTKYKVVKKVKTCIKTKPSNTNTCTVSFTIPKNSKLTTPIVSTIGTCVFNRDGINAANAPGITKLKVSFKFAKSYAATGLNYQGTATKKTNILKPVKRTIVLKIGGVTD